MDVEKLLLQIISEQLQPDTGYIDYGDTVVVGYYKQDGLLLTEDCKVIEVIQNISESIEIGNGTSISPAQFLESWLFPRNMHYMYVSRLSGGEKTVVLDDNINEEAKCPYT